MDCRHVRGVDGQGFCRMCGYLVNGDKREARKKLVEVTNLLEIDLKSPVRMSEKDREHLKQRQSNLMELAFK
jgi:hypothetical protein